MECEVSSLECEGLILGYIIFLKFARGDIINLLLHVEK